jgi:hypothetical protein
MDMESISAAIGSLKTATDIVTGLVQLKLSSEVQAKVSELQGQILTAQASALAANSEQFSLLQQVRSLEAQIAQMKDWEAEKTKYDLTAIGTGAFTYARKADVQPPQPPHWICAACYENGVKSVLQDAGDHPQNHQRLYRCQRCKGDIQVHWKQNPSNPSGS